ncbi:phytanoyl-CoA dioxygenase family protein [Pandoraea fibrosis]|uniref:Phytanoyl-CoA dioxygenase family protein n=2 Tax=Pandoraea fibrosis TaxID=1891094 RepID=A0ABX6HY92_9BURK|nr:phytanoyl-CoA dioxygenase family protein [Pandoraea fibrosis]QHF15935.1 phytanoyl-CoA dioxygenase family protein [Pandoraea fibrosis]
MQRLQQAFSSNGFVVLRGIASEQTCDELEAVTRAELRHPAPPLEFEADVGYAGAPASREATGGNTIRRLRNAYGRHEAFRRWASSPQLVNTVATLLDEEVCLTLAHHNCVMTKHPHFGSKTGWHRDIRYWSFKRAELVVAWLALGDENEHNGALRVIPTSHRTVLADSQLDDAAFLVESHPDSAPLLRSACSIALRRGDVLLFHSQLFHAAGQNLSDSVKLSIAFAFFGASNSPLEGTRSHQTGFVALGRGDNNTSESAPDQS